VKPGGNARLFSFHAPSFAAKIQNLTADNTDDTDLHGSKKVQ
jgi:hypothetical protein